ncbi:MAG: endonuclease/exonuclease/phosphatase family protein [Bacteroidota bacterium]
MSVVRIVLVVLAVLFVVATVLPLFRAPYWWVRMFDFPRAQIAVAALVTLTLFGIVNVGVPEAARWEWMLFGALVVSVAYQGFRMIRYTPLYAAQTVAADPALADERRRLRLVVSNVRMDNRDGDRWMAVVPAEDPDVIAAVETDSLWADRLGEGLAEDYPHRITIPQDDTYGMCVFSRLPIVDHEVRHLVEEEVPSLFLVLRLRSGEEVRLVVLHPRPPRPDIQQDSHLRDAELVRAAREVATFDAPTVVAGDLNDVAWSTTTTLFQKISGLLDPRIGRGLYATFHADHGWLRYPLDHVFHSDHLALVELRRLGHVGSDHFPMLVEFEIAPSVQPLQDAPQADAEDVEQGEERVEDAEQFKARETPEEKQERIEEDV